MSDGWAIVLALAAAAGALVPSGVPVAAVAVAALGALCLRRPAVLCVAVALLASGLAARAWAGLAPPEPRAFAGTVTLLSDPEPVAGAVRVVVRVGGRRVEAWARGSAAGRLDDRLAGERIELRGRLRPPPDAVRSRLARGHVSAQLEVEAAGAWWPGDPVSRLANGIRRLLGRGAATLPDRLEGLFLGVVLGDDRRQPADLADDFRATGLTHLLAVSGQNVAFVLAAAGPVRARLGLRGRWAFTVGLVAFFALVTRFEPSVLRAAVMAGLAATAAGLGRPASGGRLLALAVATLVLVDPFLVRSVGFQLSVGASAGILALSGPLARRLPGPRWLAAPLSTTLAAQAGTAPVLVPVFGGVPAATVPANLLAVPAAGPLMVWGLTAGLAAGMLGGRAASLIQVPSVLLAGWIAGVAAWTARLGLGELGGRELLLAGLLAAGALVGWRRSRRVAGLLAAGALVAVLVPASGGPPGVADGLPIDGGGVLWRAAGPRGRAASVLVLERPSPGRLLAALRRLHVDQVDVLVIPSAGVQAAEAADPVLRRLRPRLVLAPAGWVTGAVAPPPGATFTVGGVRVRVAAASPRLDVEVSLVASRSGTARSPPGAR